MNPTLCAPFSVAKFGGTSVANYTAMRRCADIIHNDKTIAVVVVSASAGITNLLVALAEGRSAEIRQQHLKKIADLQYAILGELTDNDGVRSQVDHFLNHIRVLSEASALASSAALTDELVAHGELLSSWLFTEVLNQHAIAAKWFDVRQIMRTDSSFGKAVPQIQRLRQLACAYLKSSLSDRVIVTQGFIGSDSKGRTTTLGRGGSDYSAALLGEALGADHIGIWSDVAGIYTTDPNVVRSARPIETMTFSEAAELASFGAKILHPATLIPAIRSHIPLFVGSSTEKDTQGTWIGTPVRHADLPAFRAITLRRAQTLLTLRNLHHRITPDFLTAVFGIMSNHKLTVDLVSTSEVGIAFTLDPIGSNTDNRVSMLSKALPQLSKLGHVDLEENCTLVTLIGNHLSEKNGLIASVFTSLSPYSMRLSCFGASPHSLCFLVQDSDANAIVRTLHAHLFESENNDTPAKVGSPCISY